ncbi:MAG: TonB-dependent receptor, partial [Steroidobacteraceae bacterium]
MRRTLFLSIALALQTVAVPALAQETRITREAIPSQSLDSALNALSRQTGLQFVYSVQTIGNPQTRAISAGLSPDAVLAQLLAGTGLRHRYLNAGTITIEADTATGTAPSAAAGAAAGASLAGAGVAGEAVEDPMHQLERIDVVGSYSRSLEKAVDIKRATVGFSDSIVATDVADFPEQ